MTKDLEHFGIPGMKWGVRKPTTRTTVTRKGDKHYLTEKTKKGTVVSKTAVSKADAEAFTAKLKAEKLKARLKNEAKREKVEKIAGALVLAYSAYSMANLFAPGLVSKVSQTIAWNTGKVISNTPLR